MTITKDDVLKALSTVQDPDLKKDLVSLNMVKDIEIKDSKISFTVVLTTPACPLKELIKNDCLKAIQKITSEYEININMTGDVSSMAHLNPSMPTVKNIIGVCVEATNISETKSSSFSDVPVRPLPPRFCARYVSSGTRLM